MRDLYANTSLVYYKQYLRQEEILDEYGNNTGSYIPIYGELKCARLCVSPNKGNAEYQQFGTLEDYDKTMTTSNTNVEINENSILWIDDADTKGPYNYVVKAKSSWKNSVQFAIKKVTISEYQEEQKKFEMAKQMKVASIQRNET